MMRLVNKRYVHDLAVRESTRQAFIRQGPIGRSSLSGHVATVFGCTGFLGRYLVNNLGKGGSQVVTPYRGTDDDRRHLKVMGDLGQIHQLRFDLRNEEQIYECVRHSDTVYNLVGRDFTTKNFSFDQVHVEGAARLARIAKEAGVSKFIHISAMNADVNSPSSFLRSKALGEKAVREIFPDAIIVRPGTMYGYEDKFYNRMFWFAKFGFLPVLGDGQATVSPVYIGDVAAVLAQAISREDISGTTIELYGPHKYTWKSIYKFFSDVTLRNFRLIHLPKPVYELLASGIDTIHTNPIISKDEVIRLGISEKYTKSPEVLTFENFDIQPLTTESTVAKFIKLFIPQEYQHLSVEKYMKKYQNRMIE